MTFGVMDIEREDPNDIRLTPYDAGVIGGPVDNGHRERGPNSIRDNGHRKEKH